MTKVKIKVTTITQQYGVLQADDIIACSDEFAKHLVDECKAGDYLEVPKSIEEIIETKEVKPTHKRKG